MKTLYQRTAGNHTARIKSEPGDKGVILEVEDKNGKVLSSDRILKLSGAHRQFRKMDLKNLEGRLVNCSCC